MSILIVVFLIVLIFITLTKKTEKEQWLQKENMPDDLYNSKLFLSEEQITTNTPIALHGRVDQVFKTDDDLLIPIETKTRKYHRIYSSDIIQLSVYRILLTQKYNYPVANYGYVRTVVINNTTKEKNVRYTKRALLDDSYMIDLWRRYHAIKSGEVNVSCSCGGRLH